MSEVGALPLRRRPLPLGRLHPPIPSGTLQWALGGSALAAAVGAAASWNTQAAVGIVLVLGLTLWIVLRPATLLTLLVVATSVELISVGGVRITRLVTPMAAVVLGALAVRGQVKIRPQAPLVWAGAYSIWALASGLWTQSLGGTGFLLASLAICLVYLVAFSALTASRADLDRLLYAFSAASFLMGLSSIAFFTGRHQYAFHSKARASGGTGDPSFFAAFQLVGLPLMLVLAAHTERRWLRRALYLAAIVNAASVLSTISRGGTIQLLVVVVLLLLVPARAIFRSSAQKWVAVGLIVVGTLFFFHRYSVDLLPRLSSTFSQGHGGANQTGSGRLIVWPAAWDAFSAHPWTGIGYGAFVRTSIDRMYDTRNTQIGAFHMHPEEVHNLYLGTATELGLPGLALFLGLLIATALALRRAAVAAQRVGAVYVARIANALLIALVGWCVGSMFIETETSRPIWIVIGLTLALPKLIDAHVAVAPAGHEAPAG